MDKILLRPEFTVHYRARLDSVFQLEPATDYTAFLLLGGKIQTNIDEQKIALARPGELLLFGPGANAAKIRNERAEHVLLNINPSYLIDCAVRTRLARRDSIVNFRAGVIERDAKAERIGRDLAEELIEEEQGQITAVAALIEQLLVHLLRRHSVARRADELELSRAGLVDRRIRRAVELMHARLAEDLPLEDLAAAAYLSPFHFARLFKKLTGTSPHAYLAALRAARARTLLAETDLTVTEIAARVGHTSHSHFTKAFRQATGLTPRAFRAALVKLSTR
ncbi:MAG TPA: helix-turn-helix domain-containing protein [Pyrinomonadaceae bacterium]|jgi:AraC family transcriptional regulator|nr:helix-turn-helix domain-containing protein [Pyrinomonadaceae bacterium]